MTRPPWEVADVIRRAGDKFLERYCDSLTWTQLRVLCAIARDAQSTYWQAVNAKVEAVVFPPGVTDKGPPVDVELVCSWEGEQSGLPPLPGIKACASTV